MPSDSPPTSEAARLTVTGSGVLCGPWWMGCGAVFAVEAPGWSLPADWAPNADDARFAVDFRRHGERTRITGVRQAGQDRVGPGAYRFVVIKTVSPDTEPEGTFEASVLCSKELEIPHGIRAVSVNVEFAYHPSSCTIATSMDVPTAAPSS
jgi:hypothetical protein